MGGSTQEHKQSNQISIYDPPAPPVKETQPIELKPRLSDSLTAFEVFLRMCDGHTGCMTFLKDLMNRSRHDNRNDGMGHIYYLDSIGIYGSRAYKLWNECCERDIEKVELVLLNHRAGQLSTDEIHANLDQVQGTPFLYLHTFDELREIFAKRRP